MTTDNDLGKILKQRRVMIPLTLMELATATGVSTSHLGRIERGDRFPSARILRKLAKPLGFGEGELFHLADYLSPPPSSAEERQAQFGKLDPSVAMALSQEPPQVQRAMLAIFSALKYIAIGTNQK